jgi:transposase-like protein
MRWIVGGNSSSIVVSIKPFVRRLWCKRRKRGHKLGLRTRSGMLNMDDLFKGRHFDREMIIICVRWYLRLKLRFEILEMMAERGISLAHTTIMRWIQLEEHHGGKRTKIRSSKYLNNLIEQDHRSIKLRLGPMLGLKRFRSASFTIAGIELMHRIR